MATLLWLDGFEHGKAASGAAGIQDTVVGTPATVMTPVRTGSRSLEISASAAIEYVSYTVAAQIVTQAFYVRFASLPGADVQIVDFNIVTAARNGKVHFQNSTGKLALQIGTGALVAGGPVLATNTWYRVVVEYDSSTTTFTIRARIDGGTEFSQTLGGAVAADQTAVRLGTPSAQTYTGYFDDWLISVTNGDYGEIAGWSSHQIESLIPNSDGTHNIVTANSFDSFTATVFSNATTNGNTFIGHRPLQVANTANQVIRQQLAGTTEYMEFGNENLADNTKAVAGVRTYGTLVQSTGTGTSPKEARLLLADTTEVLTTGSLSAIDTTADPGVTLTIYKRMTDAPSGGWDGTKVDGLKWRIGFSDGAPDDNFIDLMVEVAQSSPGAQTVTGIVLEATPSLPTGTVAISSILGVALQITPSLPTGTVSAAAGGQTVTGVVLTATPSLPIGALTHTLTGVALSATPTLPTGKLNHSVTGVTITVTPSLPTGALKHSITGVTITTTPSLPTGALTHSITGIALTATPTLPTGQVTGPGAQTVTGIVLTVTPTLPVGALTHMLTGTALTIVPVLPIGALAAPQTVTGIVLTITPTLPAGLVTTIAIGAPVRGPTLKASLAGDDNAVEELAAPPRATPLDAGSNSLEEA